MVIRLIPLSGRLSIVYRKSFPVKRGLRYGIVDENYFKKFMRKSIFSKNKNRYLGILLLVILIGIFLRSYRFGEWLTMAPDQVRDLKLVSAVVSGQTGWPLLGPDMSGAEGFRLGPIYYYFQIVSGEIFGVSAASQAYPDWLFSVLSIPLLYYFLTRYWSERISLTAAGLYAVSFFVIEYSRFAWNVNPIPFFTLLFLLGFWQLLAYQERISWWWSVSFGVALGVGVQLHAILLSVFSIMTLGLFVYMLVKNPASWQKVFFISIVALALNAGQLASEFQTGFANTKKFFIVSGFKSSREEGSIFKGVLLDIACNTQAHLHTVSSLGNDTICNFLYPEDERSTTYRTPVELSIKNPVSLLVKFVGLLFFLCGLCLLVSAYRRESDRTRKRFLLTLILYETVFFIVMLPLAPASRLRYFLPVTVLPFISLALISDAILKRYVRRGLVIVGVLFGLLYLLNLHALWVEAARLASIAQGR